MIITTFAGVRPQGRSHELSWAEVTHSMRNHIMTKEKEKCTGFSLAKFTEDYRKNINVEEVHGIAFDFDGQPLEDLLPMFHGLRYFYYSTYSHPHPEKGDCWRLVIPFPSPVTPLEYQKIWKYLFFEFNGLADPSCKDPSRFFFKPSCHPDREEHKFFGEGDGDYINIDTILREPDDIQIDVYDEVKENIQIEKTTIAPPKTSDVIPDYNSLDLVSFWRAKGLYFREKQNDKYETHYVECPWRAEHTDGAQGETDTYSWYEDNHVFFHCSHSHCVHRNITHVIDRFQDYGDYCSEVYYERKTGVQNTVETETTPRTEQRDIDEIKIKALGVDYSGKFVYQASHTNLITRLTAGQHNKSYLTGVIAYYSFWLQRFPSQPDKNGKVKVSWEMAAESLMQECQMKGRYDAQDTRGVGIWKDGDDLVFNTGKMLLVNMEEVQYFEYEGKYHYEPISSSIDPIEPVGDTEAYKLQELINKLPIKSEIEKIMLAGAIVLGGFSGVLDWRSHLWLLGTSGSGKSTTLQKVIYPMWRPLKGLFFEAGTTESGVRQNILRNAVPILVDEVKAQSKKDVETISDLISLIRSSSANTTGIIAKGTSGQDSAQNFRVKSMFVLASVDHYLKSEQDRERFTKISFKPTDATRKNWARIELEIEDQLTEEFALGVFSRTLHNLPTLLRNIKTLKHAIVKNTTYNARFADQVSSLLAGAYSLSSVGELTSESAYSLFCSYTGWDTYLVEKEDTVMSSYTSLLSSFIQSGGERITVSRLIERLLHQYVSEGRKPKQNMLTEYGLKLDFEKKSLFIANKQHPNTRKLFEEAGIVDYQEALLRLPEAKKVNTQYYSTGMQMRSIEVPIAVLAKKGEIEVVEKELACA